MSLLAQALAVKKDKTEKKEEKKKGEKGKQKTEKIWKANTHFYLSRQHVIEKDFLFLTQHPTTKQVFYRPLPPELAQNAYCLLGDKVGKPTSMTEKIFISSKSVYAKKPTRFAKIESFTDERQVTWTVWDPVVESTKVNDAKKYVSLGYVLTRAGQNPKSLNVRCVDTAALRTFKSNTLPDTMVAPAIKKAQSWCTTLMSKKKDVIVSAKDDTGYYSGALYAQEADLPFFKTSSIYESVLVNFYKSTTTSNIKSPKVQVQQKQNYSLKLNLIPEVIAASDTDLNPFLKVTVENADEFWFGGLAIWTDEDIPVVECAIFIPELRVGYGYTSHVFVAQTRDVPIGIDLWYIIDDPLATCPVTVQIVYETFGIAGSSSNIMTAYNGVPNTVNAAQYRVIGSFYGSSLPYSFTPEFLTSFLSAWNMLRGVHIDYLTPATASPAYIWDSLGDGFGDNENLRVWRRTTQPEFASFMYNENGCCGTIPIPEMIRLVPMPIQYRLPCCMGLDTANCGNSIPDPVSNIVKFAPAESRCDNYMVAIYCVGDLTLKPECRCIDESKIPDLFEAPAQTATRFCFNPECALSDTVTYKTSAIQNQFPCSSDICVQNIQASGPAIIANNTQTLICGGESYTPTELATIIQGTSTTTSTNTDTTGGSDTTTTTTSFWTSIAGILTIVGIIVFIIIVIFLINRARKQRQEQQQ